MKGIVLAGGLGTRLYPLTKVTNKHLLPIYNKPMIYYPIELMVDAGIRDILIVTGGNNAGDFLRLLGNGKEFGLNHINYTYQEGEGGIAAALSLAEFFADRNPICVILGDNIVEGSISQYVKNFKSRESGARILLKEVIRSPDGSAFLKSRATGSFESMKTIASGLAICRNGHLHVRPRGLRDHQDVEAVRDGRA